MASRATTIAVLLATFTVLVPGTADQVDVFFEGVPSGDHADLLYLVHVSESDTVRVLLPLNSEVLGVYWFSESELRSSSHGELKLPPKSEWSKHAVHGWRTTHRRIEWRETGVYVDRGWYVRVPVEGFPEGVRRAFGDLLDRGYVDVPVLEARVDRGLLVVEVRARAVNGHLLLAGDDGYHLGVSFENESEDVRDSYVLWVDDGRALLDRGASFEGLGLCALSLEDLRRGRLEPVTVSRGGPEVPPSHSKRRALVLPPVVPPVRRRRWAIVVLFSAVLALPASVHADSLPLPRPEPLDHQLVVLRDGDRAVHVLLRLWPGVEGTVYVPRLSLELAAIVPADIVLTQSSVEDVERWCERYHPPSPPSERASLRLPEWVHVVSMRGLECSTRSEYLLESQLGRILKPLLENALALHVRTDDDAFLYLRLRSSEYLPIGLTANLLLEGLPRYLCLVRAGDQWYVGLNDSRLLRNLHPDLYVLVIPWYAAGGALLKTNLLQVGRLRDLARGPETIVLRLARADAVLLDVVATVPEVPLPAGARILRCATVPRDAYREAYTGVHAPGAQPARWTVVREGTADVPGLGKLKYQVVRVDLPKDRLAVLRVIVPMNDRRLIVPVLPGSHCLVGDPAWRVGAAGLEWWVFDKVKSGVLLGGAVVESRRPWLKELLVKVIIAVPVALALVTLEGMLEKLLAGENPLDALREVTEVAVGALMFTLALLLDYILYTTLGG